MSIKFILLIIITQKSLIQCKISSQFNFDNSSNDVAEVKVIRAIDNAILMTMTQDISLITDSSNHRRMNFFRELLLENLYKKVSFTLTNINLRYFASNPNDTTELSSLMMILVLEDYESFHTLFLPNFTNKRTNFKTTEIFLLIFLNDTTLDASKVFNEFWKLYIYNVVIIKSYQGNDKLVYGMLLFINCNCCKCEKYNLINCPCDDGEGKGFSDD